MVGFNRIDMSERIDTTKTTGLHECIICHYCYFYEINFRYQPKVCDDCFNKNHNHYYCTTFLEKCSYK